MAQRLYEERTGAAVILAATGYTQEQLAQIGAVQGPLPDARGTEDRKGRALLSKNA